MRNSWRTALAFGGLVLGLTATATAQTTWTVAPSGGNFTTLSQAIANASVVNGDTIMVAAGTYGNGNGLASPTAAQRQTLTVSKQLTIVGAGIGQTIVTHTTAPGTDTPCIDITAANVTLRDLTIQYGNGEGATIYRGSGLRTARANTTLERVQWSLNYARRGVFINNGSTNTTIRDCDFVGNMNREVLSIGNITTINPGTLTIEGNTFRTTHFREGAIFLDGASGPNLVIRNNFFLSRYGVLSAGGTMPDANYGFDSTALGLYNIYVGTLTAGRTTLIKNNTFVFQDPAALNRGGAVPQMRAIDMATTANHGTGGAPVTILDNIFAGYQADESAQLAAQGPAFVQNSSGGVFGGAVELNGTHGYGEFNGTAAFNIGAKGTMTAWVKLDNGAKRNQIFEGPGNGNLEFQFRETSGGQFFMRPFADTDYVIEAGPSNSTDWQLVQYTWDRDNPAGNSGTARIYKGNQSTAVAEVTTFASAAFNNAITGWNAAVDTTTGVLSIGRDPGDSTRFFDGMMDDVAFFNDVLTPAELETIRTSGVAGLGADSRLVAHWSFDEASGGVAASSVNSLDAQLLDTRTGAVTAYVVASGATPTVNNNLYFNNEAVYLTSVTDAAQVLGDPRFVASGSTVREFYTPLGDSPAIGAASDGGTIGAVQVTAPTIVTNAPLRVIRDGTAFITSTYLSATDPEQGPAQLTYTVTGGPSLGTLSATTFTQADINNNLLTCTNTAAGTSDSFTFSLSDGTPVTNPPVTGTFNIMIFLAEDTDRDGVPDEVETTVYGTLTNDRDTDNDGVEDGVEIAIGTDPLSSSSPLAANRTDSDGDLIPNFYDSQPANADSDADGTKDGYEYAVNQAASLVGTPPLGDANNDGTRNNADAFETMRVFLGLPNAEVVEEKADVNRDGFIDNLDAVIQLNYFLGNIPYLPYP